MTVGGNMSNDKLREVKRAAAPAGAGSGEPAS